MWFRLRTLILVFLVTPILGHLAYHRYYASQRVQVSSCFGVEQGRVGDYFQRKSLLVLRSGQAFRSIARSQSDISAKMLLSVPGLERLSIDNPHLSPATYGIVGKTTELKTLSIGYDAW